MSVSKKVHSAIYAIDNVFDDDPKRWVQLSQHAPASAREALKMREPCALVQELLGAQASPFNGIPQSQNFVKGFNALAYMYRKAGEARDAVDLSRIAEPQMQEKLKTYSLRNMQASLVARGVMGVAAGEAMGSDVLRALPAMLRDDFVGSNMPEAHMSLAQWKQYGEPLPDAFIQHMGMVCRKNDQMFGFESAAIKKDAPDFENLLGFEMLNFHSDDWRDLLADLDVERKTGVPTANLVATFVRLQHPERDLQAFAQAAQERFSGEQRVSPEQLKAVDPEIASSIVQLLEKNDSLCRNPKCFVCQEAKQLARSSRNVNE